MTSELPYLKEIAGYLKAIAGQNGASEKEQLSAISKAIINASITQNNTSQANLSEVNETLQTGMLKTEVEGEGSSAHEVTKSIFDVMKDAFVQVFREAMFVVEGEGSAAQEKGVFQVMKDAIVDTLNASLMTTVTEQQGGQPVQVTKSIFEVMKDETVAAIHDSLNVTVTENNVPVEKSLAQLVNEQKDAIAGINTAIGTINTNLAGIKTDQDTIAAALSGSGGISAQLADIETALGQVKTSVDGQTANISTIAAKVTNIDDNTDANGVNIATTLDQINTKIGTTNSKLDTANSKLDTVNTNLEEIDGDLYLRGEGTAVQFLKQIKNNTA